MMIDTRTEMGTDLERACTLLLRDVFRCIQNAPSYVSDGEHITYVPNVLKRVMNLMSHFHLGGEYVGDRAFPVTIRSLSAVLIEQGYRTEREANKVTSSILRQYANWCAYHDDSASSPSAKKGFGFELHSITGCDNGDRLSPAVASILGNIDADTLVLDTKTQKLAEMLYDLHTKYLYASYLLSEKTLDKDGDTLETHKTVGYLIQKGYASPVQSLIALLVLDPRYVRTALELPVTDVGRGRMTELLHHVIETGHTWTLDAEDARHLLDADQIPVPLVFRAVCGEQGSSLSDLHSLTHRSSGYLSTPRTELFPKGIWKLSTR